MLSLAALATYQQSCCFSLLRLSAFGGNSYDVKTLGRIYEFGISITVTYFAIFRIICYYKPVTSCGRNLSTWQKPLPNPQSLSKVLARISKMPVQNSNFKISARPDLATYLLQILIPATINSLVCQKGQFTLQLCPRRWFVRKIFGYYTPKAKIKKSS